MANTANTGIKNSWSLIAFAKSHGKMQLGTFVNKQTGDSFKSCIFTDPSNSDNKVFVGFSRNLGELAPQEIKDQKDELQVVQCTNANGEDMYALCKAGADAWENIDLL